MNGVIDGSVRQEKLRQPGCPAASETLISVHFDYFQFI